MRTIQEVIDDINRYIWDFNKLRDSRNPDTLIMEDSEYALTMIKNNCQIIRDQSDMNTRVNLAVYAICKMTYGDNVDVELVAPGFHKSPFGYAAILMDLCDEGLDILKSNTDDLITEMNKKYTNKFLYFCGFEDGDDVIFIKNIHYKDNKVVWDGTRIELVSVNSSKGHGFHINEVEDEPFDDLPYYENAYSVTHPEFDPNWDSDSAQYIDKWLSLGDYGAFATGTSDNRELSIDKLKILINNHLYWGFSVEGGLSKLNIYKEQPYN